MEQRVWARLQELQETQRAEAAVLVSQVRQDHPAHRAEMDDQELPDVLETLDHREETAFFCQDLHPSPRVRSAHLGRLDHPVRQDRKASQALRAMQVLLEEMELRECLDPQDRKAHRVHREFPAIRDLRVNPAR